ncbi:hypothetical protein A2382_02145 [Candidatus Woesebacteria bacterium RIFOXYB1_FULL_38_16]|uniref:Uncharacterized protein n=1 Tax=Candidatus Woesebacteria bacterium RIFOXYB1_FULL_38_16 TaxID=1802538 RepID=A0A1F8CVD3_9BACT|nr:MAG: hypothetical protein A2191_05065 [Candidatus Woesebacteria bacterium RIFOXYA1_FULL_38_9]OGM79698.1 MAG: hypothetical protein A2382_02145 [Candidatus Woesebacteria bacterium RIFOXYB1_FULL_38_16]
MTIQESKNIKINKKIVFDFVSLVANPEKLVEEGVVWEEVQANKKIIRACWEFYLSGCELVVKTDCDSNEVIAFLEKYDFPHMQVVSI